MKSIVLIITDTAPEAACVVVVPKAAQTTGRSTPNVAHYGVTHAHHSSLWKPRATGKRVKTPAQRW